MEEFLSDTCHSGVTMHTNLSSNLRKLMVLLKNTNVNPFYFIIPALLAILSAIFEGISVSSVIPLLKGIFTMDFAFVKDLPVLKGFIGSTVSALNLNNTQIFAALLGGIFSAGVLKNILRYLSSLMVCFQVMSIANNLRQFIFSQQLLFSFCEATHEDGQAHLFAST